MQQKTPLIIIAAPSGAGKSTFLKQLTADDARFVHSISFTTRSPRAGERNGDPYFFVSVEEFKGMIDRQEFVEWAQVYENFYGTSRLQLEENWSNSKWVVMDVDVKGAANLKRIYPNSTSFFILPPSIDELRRRLEARDKKEKTNVQLRLAQAVDEMLSAPNFDFQIVNDKFDVSYAQFKKIIDEVVK